MRWLLSAVFGVTVVGLFTYSLVVAHQAFGSAVFLGLAGGILVLSVRALYRAAHALFVEAPAVELSAATGRRRKELEREKASLLKALKELDFDHEMHKVSDADFADIGGLYRARAIRVLRQLDDAKTDYAALVEEELTKKRGGPRVVGESPLLSESALASDRADARPEAQAGGSSLACPDCGTVNDTDAVFCKKCARKLSLVEGGAA